jgi:hypothetical protein
MPWPMTVGGRAVMRARNSLKKGLVDCGKWGTQGLFLKPFLKLMSMPFDVEV